MAMPTSQPAWNKDCARAWPGTLMRRGFPRRLPGSPHQQGIMAGHAPQPLIDAGGGGWLELPKGCGPAAKIGRKRPEYADFRPAFPQSPLPRPQVQREEQGRSAHGPADLGKPFAEFAGEAPVNARGKRETTVLSHWPARRTRRRTD